jgi:hypothetical protein
MSTDEKERTRITRREFVKEVAVGAAGVAAAGALASCAKPTPEVVKETVEVPVKETVEVPVEVTKIVEKTVEVPGPGETVYEVYPPYGHPSMEILQPVPRLDTLEGKTICGVSSGFYFPDTFPVMAEMWKKRYPTATFIGPENFEGLYDQGNPGPKLVPLLQQYKCDAVVSGTGC